MIQLNARGRQLGVASALLSLLLFAFLLFDNTGPDALIDSSLPSYAGLYGSHNEADLAKFQEKEQKLHILLPANKEDLNLCKTLLTSAVLDYPTPVLIGRNETTDTYYLLGGGSHVTKISGTLEYLKSLGPSQDDDLVVMMDAYDIWWQLRPSTLISRYHSINRAANARLQARLGRAFDAERLSQKIIFGAGKRCAPNQRHTTACYPLPDSPLPMDIYGTNTDTVMGRNEFYSIRQRFLNSGFIIGPVKDMRVMFARSWEKVQKMPTYSDWDNGSGGSDFMYHGSDQSIFAIMFGEQEYQREVLRRKHLSRYDKAAGRNKSPHLYLDGTLVDDPLNPSFTHEPMELGDDNVVEFGIGLDYFSELIHQTVNSELDARFLIYNSSTSSPDNIEAQIGETGIFDCPPRVNGSTLLPNDITSTPQPLDNMGWNEIPLYTHLCLNTVPLMIHHNGDKTARERMWSDVWMQPYARQLLMDVLSHSPDKAGAVDAGTGDLLGWKQLCPAEWEHEIFRDV
ncbi:hypothetical protein K431DRAFT_310500 [Polychaeton citri CBS 116435]|uniref:Uncharacterized protein n=1 Tax=Polychaeton citri CBS 116435 TaxID=1314669 RepID=A0A9P4QD20_9PEZI|nr:hypothetical protein K431DRAFT_310500 [Polychaeton citri CBS 116435]